MKMGSMFAKSMQNQSCCDTYAKYVFNAMQIKSSCSECCDFEVHTDAIELASEESEDEIEVNDCFHIKHKK